MNSGATEQPLLRRNIAGVTPPPESPRRARAPARRTTLAAPRPPGPRLQDAPGQARAGRSDSTPAETATAPHATHADPPRHTGTQSESSRAPPKSPCDTDRGPRSEVHCPAPGAMPTDRTRHRRAREQAPSRSPPTAAPGCGPQQRHRLAEEGRRPPDSVRTHSSASCGTARSPRQEPGPRPRAGHPTPWGGVGADTFSGTGSTGSAGCRAQNSLRKADPGHTAVPPLQPDDGGRRQRACWARPFPAKPPPGRGGGGCCTLPGQWTRASCAAPQTRLGFKVLSLKKNGLTLKAAVWDARRQATRPCDPAGRGRGSLAPHKAVCVAPPGQERSAGPAGPRGSARQCGGTSDSAATAAHTGDGGAWLLPPSGKRTPGLRDSRLGQAAGSRLRRRKLSARAS